MGFLDILSRTAQRTIEQRTTAPRTGTTLAECTPCAANAYVQDTMRDLEVRAGKRKPPRKKR